jgi:hypothetical protein
VACPWGNGRRGVLGNQECERNKNLLGSTAQKAAPKHVALAANLCVYTSLLSSRS